MPPRKTTMTTVPGPDEMAMLPPEDAAQIAWAERYAALRVPFPREQVGKLPRGGITLDYVGHAAVTDRLLTVDPLWSWEPMALDAGLPAIGQVGGDAVMWIRLTVLGMTRLGVGIVRKDAFERDKQLISDAIRNAAMRFGVALDLWSKEDLRHDDGVAEWGNEHGDAPPVDQREPWERLGYTDADALGKTEDWLAELGQQLVPEGREAFKAWRRDVGITWPPRFADVVTVERKIDKLAEEHGDGAPS